MYDIEQRNTEKIKYSEKIFINKWEFRGQHVAFCCFVNVTHVP